MTTPKLIELFLFSPGFSAPLRNQLCDQVSACRSFLELTPESFQGGLGCFHQQSAVLNSDAENVAFAEAELLSHWGWNHDATLSTKLDLCHQDLNVPNQQRIGNNCEEALKPLAQTPR